ncbi:MAG TPA: hypothetical protein VEZ11_16500 [Thermoanaerobaculia bacterium]|nr:hypothetical protein [Thermoanaerobaculia bacterium]
MRLSPLLALVSLAAALSAPAAEIAINEGRPLFTERIPFTISGTSDVGAGAEVTVSIDERSTKTTVAAGGTWEVVIDWPLPTGVYLVTAQAAGASATSDLRVQLPGPLPRQSPFEPAPPKYGVVESFLQDAVQEMTDRWRIAPPPYELNEKARARKIGKQQGGTLDPYNQNLFKGDIPIRGTDTFLVLTGVSDTLAESRTLPTPSGVSAQKPASIGFFGNDQQNFFNQNIAVSADVFQGDTAFKPVLQRLKATVILNINFLSVQENALVKPDVRRGTTRTNGFLSLQEIFYERKLRDLSPNYDFVSFRAGSQPFTSDFRGFIFSDTNAGVRVFGNYASNRYQYNLAIFDRREKDTNSGLNTLWERRGQQVGIANLYWQDFIWKGYTQQFSVHLMHDEPTLKYDRNGGLVRPAPIGVFQPHTINAAYIGEAGLGHIGRINVDHAVYYVAGRDSINPLAGPDPRLKDGNSVQIGAAMAALELSYDRDWLRPRFAMLYATGDRDPRNRHAGGFDSIFDATAFAGGGFSFFNRLGIRLAGAGVALVERGSLFPDLKTSKDEGQPNYVNPGIQLVSAGLDADLTPRIKTFFTANYIRLDTTKPIEALLFQGNIHRELGTDISLGAKFRPFLNNNAIITGGVAGFIRGRGFEDIYERSKALYHFFTNVTLTF